MNNHRRIIKPIIFILSVMLLWTTSITAFAANMTMIEEAYEETGANLYHQGEPVCGSVGGEWVVLGLARSDFNLSEDYCSNYYEMIEEYVEQHMGERDRLDPHKSTEHSRIIVALTSLGYDATDVAGYDLTAAYGDFDYVKRQGINGPIWALIALNSGGYGITENKEASDQTTEEGLIQYIIDSKCPGGGWSLAGDAADVDITAMAIQSLAPYYDENKDAKAAVDEGLTVLSQMQQADGGYYSYGAYNSESVAQVIVALTSLGIDPKEDERFIKGGKDLLDALMEFYAKGGAFHHVMDMPADGMATEQAYYALVAYDRLLDGETALYDMSDVEKSDSTELPWIWILIGIIALAAVGYLIFRRRDDDKDDFDMAA